MFLVFLYFFKDQSAIVLVYEGKHIAVLRNLEVYAHRKEERISRQFGSAHSDHPTVNVSPSEKVLYSISSIFDKCSILEQTIWLSNHTSHTKVYFNEFVANALCDNIGSKKNQPPSSEK